MSMQEFVELIKEERKSQEIPMKKLASITNLSIGLIHKIENSNGNIDPKASTVFALVDALGIDRQKAIQLILREGNPMKNRLRKYKKSKYFSPAYNSAFGFHNGSFFKALCEAIDRSDKDNYQRLKQAFPELCEIQDYLNQCCRDDVDKVIEELKTEKELPDVK